MTETRRIAGHDFDLRGICVREGCHVPSRRLVEIISATSEHVNQEGWAHYGTLNAAEQAEIEEERERIWRAHVV